MVNSPSWLVVVVDPTFVARLVAVTVTPGSTPPDLSLTRPVIAPRNSCAVAAGAMTRASVTAASNRMWAPYAVPIRTQTRTAICLSQNFASPLGACVPYARPPHGGAAGHRRANHRRVGVESLVIVGARLFQEAS